MAKKSQPVHFNDQSVTLQPGSADFDTFPKDILPRFVQYVLDESDEWETLKSRIRDANDVVELLKKRPDEVRTVQSTLVFHLKGTAPPRTAVPGIPERADFRLWQDLESMKEYQILGALWFCGKEDDSDRTADLKNQWCEWLATAGLLLEFIETPSGCTESTRMRRISNPMHRWVYLLHEFVGAPVFTWDLSPTQKKALLYHSERSGNRYYEKISGELVPGAPDRTRISLKGICTIHLLPEAFPVCSEVRDVIHESERLLACLQLPQKEVVAVSAKPNGTVTTDASVGTVPPADDVDGQNADSGERNDSATVKDTQVDDDNLPKKLRKLAPSRMKAQAVHEWAMSEIPNAESMTIAELFDAIQHHPSNASDALPDNAEAFGKYLREAGVKRYKSRAEKSRETVRGQDEF